jgi:hypothetical protein
MGLHLRSRRLQSGATAEAHGGASMTAPSHGHAKLLDGGSIQIAFAYHNGDQAIPKARRNTSSTAC